MHCIVGARTKMASCLPPQTDTHKLYPFSSPRFQDACEHSAQAEVSSFVARALPEVERAVVKQDLDDIEEAWAQVMQSLKPATHPDRRDAKTKALTDLTAPKPREKGSHGSENLAKQILQSEKSAASILDHLQPPRQRVTRTLHKLIDWGHHKKALKVLAWAERQPYLSSSRSYFYTAVFSSSSMHPQHHIPAKELYHKAKSVGVLHDVISYNAMISALGKAGHLGLAQSVLAEMQNEGFLPDVFTYTSMIKACQVCGCKWKLGLEYLQTMKRLGVKPNVVTYTVLISCCQRAGQWGLGMRLFKELETLGLQLDLKVANAMISACSKGAKWEDAWAITSSIRNMGLLPDTFTYNALISACQRAGQAERALEVFKRMCKDAETRPEAQATIVTFNTLMSACAKAGMYSKVGYLYKALRERGFTPDIFTLSALIQACKQQNFWEEAIELTETFERMYQVKLNTVTCNALMTTLGQAGRWQYVMQNDLEPSKPLPVNEFRLPIPLKRQEFFQALESGELDGEPDEWTYAALILALRRGQEYPQIIIFFAEMQEKDLAIYRDTYFAALEACERLGLWSEGGQILQTMQVDPRMVNAQGLDIAAWKTVFAFPPLMDSVPKPLIIAARAAVDSGRRARRLVKPRSKQSFDEEERE